MKALSIILIIAILLCALTGCQSGNITQEPNADGSLTQAPTGNDPTEPPPTDAPTEPPTLEELIATAYCKQYATQVSPKQVSWDSYGEFDGCQIGFVDGPWMYTAMLVDEIVGSYIFNYRQGYTLYVYKDGQIIKLREAYGEGWLSDETMAQLYVVFQDLYYGKKVELGDGKVDLPTDDSYENLTDDERAIVDFVVKEYYQHNKDKLGVSEERLSMRYYGEFEGCYVGFIDGDGSTEITYSPGRSGDIGPYSFKYKTSQKLIVYKNGAFLDLYKAYCENWLSDEAVGQIYEIFQQRYHGVTVDDSEPTVVDTILLAYYQKYQNVEYMSLDNLSMRYYGEYDGCHVGFIDGGPWDYVSMITPDPVASYMFYYRNGHTLDVYKDGQFLSLSEAYDAGWMSEDAIGQIYADFLAGNDAPVDLEGCEEDE